jgi:Protein of unknown function (DUF3429)
MLDQLRATPLVARLLGFGGLLPFIAAAIAAHAPDPWLQDAGRRALVAYGAVILSFLGGVRWGVAMTGRDATGLAGPLVLSILPALLGWVAVLLPPGAGAILLAACLALLLVADLRQRDVPPWYRALRVPLSVGAIASLLAGVAG